MRRLFHLLFVATALLYGNAPAIEPTQSNPSFAREVLPLLTKAGCNAGACHGAAAGRGYLGLSLFGVDAKRDFEAIVHAPASRLLDFANIDASLLLQKPTGQQEHGGETRIEYGSEDYKTLKQWIAAGAQVGPSDELLPLDIQPGGNLLLEVGEARDLTVSAHWKSGASSIANRWLAVSGASLPRSEKQAASPGSVAQPAAPNPGLEYRFADDKIVLTAKRSGYWPLTLRYGSAVKVVQVWVRPRDAVLVSRPSGKPGIDELVARAAAWVGETGEPACSDELLVRRLWMDLWGEHPALEAWQSAVRRIKEGALHEVVDELLADPRFANRVAEQLTGWVSAASMRSGDRGGFQKVVAKQIAQDASVQRLARKMLTVDSKSQAEDYRLNAFHDFADNPRSRSELVASVWLGVRIGCAQCHDHPLDKWTQDDYFALAACWAEIESTGGKRRRVAGRTTTDLRTGRDAIAGLPVDGAIDAQESVDIALVKWITSSENDLFAANVANRVWYWLIGVGLVDEVDDFRETNPAINAPLLDRLADILRENDYSVRHLVRDVVLSDAYARASSVGATALHSRLGVQRVVKPLDVPLENLVQQVFGLEDQPTRTDTSESTMMMADEPSECTRAIACGDPFGNSMQLVVGERLNGLIHSGVTQMASDHHSASRLQMCDDLHQRMFGDLMQPQQRSSVGELLSAASSLTEELEIVEDIVWSWIVSDTFRKLH